MLTGDANPLKAQDTDVSGDADTDEAAWLTEWRSVPLPDGTHGPFIPPKNGFHVRNIIGADNIAAASTIALARAYDNRLAATSGPLTGDALDKALRTARVTPLTAEGTGSAQVLEDSHGAGALSAFFEHASGDSGYETAA